MEAEEESLAGPPCRPIIATFFFVAFSVVVFFVATFFVVTFFVITSFVVSFGTATVAVSGFDST